MKSNAQLLNEITAAMADAWLAACERRVIGWAMDGQTRGAASKSSWAARGDTYEKHRYDRGKPIPVNEKIKVKIVPYFCRQHHRRHFFQ